MFIIVCRFRCTTNNVAYVAFSPIIGVWCVDFHVIQLWDLPSRSSGYRLWFFSNKNMTTNPRNGLSRPQGAILLPKHKRHMQEKKDPNKSMSAVPMSIIFIFSCVKQCIAMHDNNGSLYGRRQNRVEAIVRSGRGDETKRDERDNLHCGVVSHSAMKRHRWGLLRAAASCRTIAPIRHNHAALPNTLGEHCGGCSSTYSSPLLWMGVQMQS